MNDLNLIAVCLIAFTSVFTLLGFLAMAMAVITRVFPEQQAKVDAALLAAISGTVSTLIPGAQVTRIEEES